MINSVTIKVRQYIIDRTGVSPNLSSSSGNISQTVNDLAVQFENIKVNNNLTEELKVLYQQPGLFLRVQKGA